VIRPLTHKLLIGVLLISGGVMAAQLGALLSIAHSNSLIADFNAGHTGKLSGFGTAAPEVRLAQAVSWQKQRRYEEALACLNGLLDTPDPALQATVRYNLGNLYLAQAVAKTEASAFNDAIPLASLAKQAYRQALALDSHYWDAKYNLEVAMRLLPEMARINSEDDRPFNQTSQLWTTVPGFPRGLP